MSVCQYWPPYVTLQGYDILCFYCFNVLYFSFSWDQHRLLSLGWCLPVCLFSLFSSFFDVVTGDVFLLLPHGARPPLQSDFSDLHAVGVRLKYLFNCMEEGLCVSGRPSRAFFSSLLSLKYLFNRDMCRKASQWCRNITMTVSYWMRNIVHFGIWTSQYHHARQAKRPTTKRRRGGSNAELDGGKCASRL